MQTYSVGAERLRLEAEEQARKAAEEEQRQELIQLQTEREDARLANERYHPSCWCCSRACTDPDAVCLPKLHTQLDRPIQRLKVATKTGSASL